VVCGVMVYVGDFYTMVASSEYVCTSHDMDRTKAVLENSRTRTC